MTNQILLLFGFGVLFIITMLVLALFLPKPTSFQYLVFRVVLSLAAAGVGAILPGLISVELSVTTTILLRAGGALAVFVAVLYINPAKLATHVNSQESPCKHKLTNIHVNVIANETLGKPLQSKKNKNGIVLNTYDCDLPPLLDIWVGRTPELQVLEDLNNGVLVITGIGGQGKSALAAKALSISRHKSPDTFWDWRDCREQSDKFRTQLVSVLVHFEKGNIKPDALGDADINWLTKYFFQRVGKQRGTIIFDNVDHYVDVDNSLFTQGISTFVGEALRVDHNLLIIFTCRPRISYPSVRFREIYLRGFDLPETRDLFSKKLPGGVQTKHEAIIARFRCLTNGHPLWITLIASQVGRKQESAELILRQLEDGDVDDRAKAMLRGMWAGLNENQQMILRCMAELPKAMDAHHIFAFATEYVGAHNRFDRAFRALLAISLVIEKGSSGNRLNRYELHPLVKAFVLSEYRDKTERADVLAALLKCCEVIVIRLQAGERKEPTVELLEQIATKVELEIASGEIQKALETLSKLGDVLIVGGVQEEFIRLGRMALANTNWRESPWVHNEVFEKVLDNLAKLEVEMGQLDEIRPQLVAYAESIPRGTARYIGICELFSYLAWFEEKFSDSIKWGELGVALKTKSGLDTSYDSGYNLALARRDSGNMHAALKDFSCGESLESIIKKDHMKSGRNSAFYGNIGRCLQLQGDATTALTFFARSFDKMGNEANRSTSLNRGYAALWLGEVLDTVGDKKNAHNFFMLAASLWKHRAPRKAEKANKYLEGEDAASSDSTTSLSVEKLEEWCNKWVRDWLLNQKPSITVK